MKIAIFGASGATGRELVRQALLDGHIVTAFVRDSSKLNLQVAGLHLIQGDVSNYEIVEQAIQGQDAVLSALGVSKHLKTDPVVIIGIANIIRAMTIHHVSRLIYLSFIAAGEGVKDAGFMIRYIISRVVHEEIADHQEKEKLIKQSSLNWTIVHPPKLSDGAATGKYRTGENIRAGAFLPILSRADLADYMLKLIIDDSAIKKTMRIF